MATERCPRCRGARKTLALGGMMKDCPECGGVGHKKVEEKKEVKKKG